VGHCDAPDRGVKIMFIKVVLRRAFRGEESAASLRGKHTHIQVKHTASRTFSSILRRISHAHGLRIADPPKQKMALRTSADFYKVPCAGPRVAGDGGGGAINTRGAGRAGSLRGHPSWPNLSRAVDRQGVSRGHQDHLASRSPQARPLRL
jgi:hypothetical protein